MSPDKQVTDIPEDEFEGRPDLVKKRARAFMFQRAFVAFLAAFMVVSTTLLVVNAVQGFETRGTLLDCTTPDGGCYQDSQERSAEILRRVYEDGLAREAITRQIIVLASACAGDREHHNIDEIERCVNKRLAKEFRINIKEVP